MTLKRLFQHVQFLTSVAELTQLPPDTGYEIAFVGRSNAGKSSVLNTLCQNPQLARTSKTPGRTQLINFFDIGQQRRLVDLPGYGFAKVPAQVHQRFEKTLGRYIAERTSLMGLIIIMDIRHPLKEKDRQMIAFAAARGLPQLVLLNKADKLPYGQRNTTYKQLETELVTVYGEDLAPELLLYSCLKPIGRDAIIPVLRDWLHL